MLHALLELKKGDLMPTDTVVSNMELFVKTMKPIVEITEALGARKYVTFSLLRPLLYKLLNKVLLNCDSVVKMMKLKMKEHLHDRYADSVLDLLIITAFLDPRFKSLTFVTDSCVLKTRLLWRLLIVVYYRLKLLHLVGQRSVERGSCYIS